MNSRIIGKKILLYIIAINIIKTNTDATTELTKLFTYFDDQSKLKEIQLNEGDARAVLEDKPTGLQRTVLDLDFPEGTPSNNTDSRYRIVQCLAVGHIDYIQKKTYKNVSLKLTAKVPYEQAQECTNTIIVTLSPPGTIGATDNVLTNVYKIFQKEVTLKNNESTTFVFEDVLDSGFLKMDLFWVNFEIKGKCSKYLEVDLLKPQNSSLYGDKDGPDARTQATGGQGQAVSPAA
ncbi:conserved hypothetical protein [Theileria orientalis strain Shintoku]|uniref:Uncharacterized protein n=1 Tax=Theileria orientalis strain Shintoku TaxID=869250 RepID=J4C992_THEOR|nr:conserved hypothetical protein [Theileria orientalis strain Shintoku]PVC50833.1 hypothetical protein MACL_00002005 [Theileria orientalis]BAM42133.1 conserved hypothetical protein [Theileria orientalis strain Shintoku]|eukprot:XP_009692434.1 conserved hypothetical protein [Theileria orientalis strain Shintoku]